MKRHESEISGGRGSESGHRQRDTSQSSGIDFKTANESQLEGVPDEVVLSIAAAEGRVLVTHDRQTMPTHFGAFIEQSISSGVIVAVKKLPIRAVIDDLIDIWIYSDAEDFENRIRFLPW